MSRYYIRGDLHGSVSILKTYNDFNYFDANDVLIILGDFGVIWDEVTVEKNIKCLEDCPYTIAFVDGNHENFNLIKEKEQIENWNGGKVGRISKNIIHLLRGEIYNLNGKRVGVMGGADSVDKWHRIENKSWWKTETITNEDVETFRANLDSNNKIDIMLTHDCPSSLVPIIKLYSGINGGRITNSQKQLEIINNLANIEKWYFGHWHLDRKINSKFECLYKLIKEI